MNDFVNLREQMTQQLIRSMGIPAHLAGGPMTEEQAFWLTIGENPGDQLPRLVFADWLEECGRWDEGAALRATADRVPRRRKYGWEWRRDGEGLLKTEYRVCKKVYEAMSKRHGNHYSSRWYRSYTAEKSIRDLCRAWRAVHRPEVKA